MKKDEAISILATSLRPREPKDRARYDEAVKMAIDALNKPERNTGKWIDAVIPNDNGDLLIQVCDQCNTFFPLAYTGGWHHFCPNCGAKMEGGE